MPRFGSTHRYYPELQGRLLPQLFIRLFGSLDTGSSHLHFLRTVKDLPLSGFKTVLDAGCGRGAFTFWLAQNYADARYHACDLSESNIQICKSIQAKTGTRCHFFVQDLVGYCQPDSYDFILTNHVLEHIPRNREVITNLCKSLKAGGFIYIQIPNPSASRIFPDRYFSAHDRWAKQEHTGQSLTLETLADTVQLSGCQVLIKRYVTGFWGSLSFELKEISLNYLKSYPLFGILFPFLKLFSLLDARMNYRTGNGLLVLARKT